MDRIDIARRAGHSTWKVRKAPLAPLNGADDLYSELKDTLARREQHLRQMRRVSELLGKSMKGRGLDLGDRNVKEFYGYGACRQNFPPCLHTCLTPPIIKKRSAPPASVYSLSCFRRYASDFRASTLKVCDLLTTWQTASWQTGCGMKSTGMLIAPSTDVGRQLAAMKSELNFLSQIAVLQGQLPPPTQIPHNRRSLQSTSNDKAPHRLTVKGLALTPDDENSHENPDPLLASMTLSGLPIGEWAFRGRKSVALHVEPDEGRALVNMMSEISSREERLQAALHEEKVAKDKLEAAKHDIKSAEDNGASDTAALKILKEREYELRAALGELQPSAGMSAEAQIKDFKEQKIPDLEEHVAREKAHAKKLQGSQSEISQLKERAHRVNEDMAEMRYKLEDAEHELAEEELTLGRLQTEALRLVVAVCREGTGYVGPDAWSSIGPLNGAWPSEQAA
mmetsp:Transcript_30059/g.75750  ORF Transcript_30059/g.75750 Transcript_30059/m.75750 type:complete len:452 (+) Transcript_30059:593-1948(+)